MEILLKHWLNRMAKQSNTLYHGGVHEVTTFYGIGHMILPNHSAFYTQITIIIINTTIVYKLKS